MYICMCCLATFFVSSTWNYRSFFLNRLRFDWKKENYWLAREFKSEGKIYRRASKTRLDSRYKRDRSAYFSFTWQFARQFGQTKYTFPNGIDLASNDIWLCANTSTEPTKLLLFLQIRDYLQIFLLDIFLSTESKMIYFYQFFNVSLLIKSINSLCLRCFHSKV